MCLLGVSSAYITMCVRMNLSCVLDRQAAAAADPAAAQDQPAPAADPGQLLSRPSHSFICYIITYPGTRDVT